MNKYVGLLMAMLIGVMVLSGPGRATSQNELPFAEGRPAVGQPFVLLGGPTVRVSLRSDGGEADRSSFRPGMSSDGRYVVFESFAENLVSNDTNDATDIFVRDQQNGTTTRVSVATGGGQAISSSTSPSISGDGRYVVFHSSAVNLVSGDTNNVSDIFIHDRQTGETRRVSQRSNGTQGNDVSYNPVIAEQGEYVVFWSYASTLVDNDTNGKADVFIWERATGNLSRVSTDTNNNQANGDSQYPTISGGGRFVAFESVASNLVTGDSGLYRDIFLKDRQTGETKRISVRGNGEEGEGDSYRAVISGNNQHIAYTSFASNLIDGDTNLYPDVFVYERLNNLTYRESVSSNGAQLNAFTQEMDPALSYDGRYLVFSSVATNLVSNDSNNSSDIFLRDRSSDTTVFASVSSAGSQGNAESIHGAINYDGQYVAFASEANNLVANDTNEKRDIFVHDTTQSPPPPPPAAMTINYGTGAVGSYFNLIGTNFPANQTASVKVNNVQMSGATVAVDSSGNFGFTLFTLGADNGVYLVQVTVQSTIRYAQFNLMPTAAVRPREGGYVVMTVPAGISLDLPVYLPLAAEP